MKYLWYTITLLASLIVTAPIVQRDPKISPRLQAAMDQSGDRQLIWVYLTDKASVLSKSMTAAQLGISEKAVLRRAKAKAVITALDYPIDRTYLDDLKNSGFQIRQESRWLNAVSGYASNEAVDPIARLSFVRSIDVVRQYKKNTGSETPVERPSSPIVKSLTATVFDSAFYGMSYTQLRQVHVPEVHKAGIFGQGVTVAIFDNGFRLLRHEVFDSMQIDSTYDFVDHKVNVAPNNPRAGFGAHGVNTLSTIGGYKQGQLIGPAFRAHFLLARTENDSSETSVEEDNWIAALQWAENLGVDLVSSSLGYLGMDEGSAPSYDWTWMNGDSTVVTKGANIGVQLGVIIVNSAGNEAAVGTPNTLIGPADGDSVIAVGAVTSGGVKAGFSSYGPTTLGKIKPDVMAMGQSVTAASAFDSAGYITVSGTSFSCPITAGVCALILSAHPELTPAQVRRSLTATASRSATPDNLYGYGIINALSAVNYYGAIDTSGSVDTTGSVDSTGTLPESFEIRQNYPNPFNPTTRISYDVLKAGQVTLEIFNELGGLVKTLVNEHQAVKKNYTAFWDGTNERGTKVSSGVYFYRLRANGFSKTRRMLLIK